MGSVLVLLDWHVKVTNDIFTKEDGEFLVRNGALAPERIRAVETGGCPHAAIREDISINLGPLEELSHLFAAEILLCESGGGPLLFQDRSGFFVHFVSRLLINCSINVIKVVGFVGSMETE